MHAYFTSFIKTFQSVPIFYRHLSKAGSKILVLEPSLYEKEDNMTFAKTARRKIYLFRTVNN